MKISILTPDVSTNGFGRAWLLAKLLQNAYDVEIIGPTFGKGIWQPLANLCNFETKTVKGYDNGTFEFKKMLKQITGDVIYSSKPLMTSFGVGLFEKITKKKPIVLDIDDYELGFGKDFYDSLPWYKKLNDFRLSIRNWNSYYHKLIINRLIFLANSITVSGQLLQKRYGGTIIWHVRDISMFNPENFDGNKFKKLYLTEKSNKSFIVGFIGTPRPHKGLEDLLHALRILNDVNVMLFIVGIKDDEYCTSFKNKVEASGLKHMVHLLPDQPFENLPEILSFIDLVVIPQRQKPASFGQIPAKIFDAMAMAKPIVATEVYEIPEILNNCGFIVKPEDPEQLARTIQYVATHPKEAKEMGAKAREKCERDYSMSLMEEKLTTIFERLMR